MLESKGWRFHRIWSTAWFRDREAELDRAEEAWKQAIEASNNDEPPSNQESRLYVPPNSPAATTWPAPKRSPQRNERLRQYCTDYRHWQLVILARWIESDTLLRTDDDLIREMMIELGFRRSGKRINDALQ